MASSGINLRDLLDTVKTYGLKKTIIAYIFVSLPIWVGIFIGGYKTNQVISQHQEQNQETRTISNQEITLTGNPTEAAEPQEMGKVGGAHIEQFNEKDWEINSRFLKERDAQGQSTGFYCVQKSLNYDSAELWLREPIPVGSALNIRYLVKNSLSNGVEPKLIFSFGKERLYRMFFPDTDNNFIGFEDDSIGGEKVFDRSRLPRSIDSTRETLLKITVGSAPPNRAILSYDLTYAGLPNDVADEPKQTLDSDSFDSQFPSVEPDGTQHQVGFGTFNGMCLKIISFEKISD